MFGLHTSKTTARTSPATNMRIHALEQPPRASRPAVHSWDVHPRGWATAIALSVATVIILSIYAGSRRLLDFDTALVPYAGATVFAAFGVSYRCTIWLLRPPTRMYVRRIAQGILRGDGQRHRFRTFIGALADKMIAQRFIAHRSTLRWVAHACLSWGTLLAVAVTFPLSFGWIRFETDAQNPEAYEGYLFGFRFIQFGLGSWLAPFVFNALVVSAVMVLLGVSLSLWRRARDRSVLAVQLFANDLAPLLALFAISVTGLLLTISTHYLDGFHYNFLSQFHAVTVIFALLYLPFGKFFHIFVRPLHVGLTIYRRAGTSSGQAFCVRCHKPYASALHIRDLKTVEKQLGIHYECDKDVHYQDTCPACRRKALAIIQDAMWRDAGRARLAEENNGGPTSIH